MTIAPFFFGVLACLAAETLVAIIFSAIGYVISKVNEGKIAKDTLDAMAEMIERKSNGWTDE